MMMVLMLQEMLGFVTGPRTHVPQMSLQQMSLQQMSLQQMCLQQMCLQQMCLQHMCLSARFTYTPMLPPPKRLWGEGVHRWACDVLGAGFRIRCIIDALAAALGGSRRIGPQICGWHRETRGASLVARVCFGMGIDTTT